MLLFFIAVAITAKAQTTAPAIQPYGAIDKADLEMKDCSFEKGANAMVLFDEAEAHYKYSSIVMERHKRIKIFNDKGKDAANIRIEYYGTHKDEDISGLEAQTVNLNNNTIEYTPVDKKQIFTEVVDKNRTALVFTFPNVKAGSIIEFKYHWQTPYSANFPDWYFQGNIPTRYSQFIATMNVEYTCKMVRKVNQKFFIDTAVYINEKNHSKGQTFTFALKDVHSLKDEPYMTSLQDNTDRLLFQISSSERTWLKIFNVLVDAEDFGKQLKVELDKEDEVLAKVNALQNDDQKIAYLFNLVKNRITWNKIDVFYVDQGISRTWNKKTGNSTEINLILCRLLKQSGIKAYPLVINSTGKLDPFYASYYQLDKTVVYIPVDSTKQYILDATDKYNVYDQIPFDMLNSNGLYIDPDKRLFQIIPVISQTPTRQIVFINADIKPDGKLNGSANIKSFSYNRIRAIKKYKTDGEKKYTDELREDDNNLKITSLKFENMEVDSLPLTQNIDFNLDLPGADENYIYVNPNLFTGLYNNPFLNEERFSDIDFSYPRIFTIDGRFKIPAGYKADVLPKNSSMLIGDKSIIFKRLAGEQDGYIVLHYSINFTRSYYTKDSYPDIRAFYKKMQEMLNEQIVLKKT